MCIIRGPLTNLKNLFEEVIGQLTANEKTKNTSTIPILSALRYRLALMSSEAAEDFKIDVAQFNSKWRQVMHVEALRLHTFSQWPHKNYKVILFHIPYTNNSVITYPLWNAKYIRTSLVRNSGDCDYYFSPLQSFLQTILVNTNFG